MCMHIYACINICTHILILINAYIVPEFEFMNFKNQQKFVNLRAFKKILAYFFFNFLSYKVIK